MVKLSSLERRLCKINQGKYLYMTLNLYKDLTYYTLYNIMELYKNYFNQPRMTIYNQFNKTMVKLYIEIEL